MAYAIGSGVYRHVRRNRGKYRKAARVIGRAYRRSRARGARRISSAKKKSTSYRNWGPGVETDAGQALPKNNVFGSETTTQLLVRKRLYAQRIKFCEPPDTNDNLRAAPRMVFHVSGFKLCGFIRNVSAQPLNVHMALIQPKAFEFSELDIKTDFFSNNAGANKYVNYIDRDSNAGWDKRQDCRNINNRKFNVVSHRRMMLNEPRENSGTTGTFQDERKFGASYKHFDEWIRLNKNFEFGAEVGTDVTKPLFLCVWFETVFPVEPPNASQNLEVNLHTLSYVRDVK